MTSVSARTLASVSCRTPGWTGRRVICHSVAGGAVTTVYTSSSERQVRYLLSDPGATGVVVENAELLQRVLAVEDELSLRSSSSSTTPMWTAKTYTRSKRCQARRGNVQRGGIPVLAGRTRPRRPGEPHLHLRDDGLTEAVRLTHRNFRAMQQTAEDGRGAPRADSVIPAGRTTRVRRTPRRWRTCSRMRAISSCTPLAQL